LTAAAGIAWKLQGIDRWPKLVVVSLNLLDRSGCHGGRRLAHGRSRQDQLINPHPIPREITSARLAVAVRAVPRGMADAKLIDRRHVQLAV
jgi:hypothetical protein